MKSSHGEGMLRLIAVFRLAKAALLFAVGFGALKLLNRDLDQALTQFAEQLKIDPGNHYFQKALSQVGGLSPKLPWVAIGTFCYGTLFCVEGVGLLLKKHWAEWLTAIATASFIPIEIYEIAKHSTITRIVVLVINIAIMVYLVVRLWTRAKGSAAKKTT